MNEDYSLQEIFRIFRKRAKVIFLFIVGTLALSVIINSFLITPKFEATSQILVNDEPNKGSTFDIQSLDAQLQMINTYSVIIKSPVILNRVIQDLGLDLSVHELADRITVQNQKDTQIVSISVLDTNPLVARDISNKTALIFQEEVQSLLGMDNIKLLSEAEASIGPVNINGIINLIHACLIGLLLGSGLVFYHEFSNSTVKNESDIENYLNLPVLGIVSNIPRTDSVKTPSIFLKMRRRAKNDKKHLKTISQPNAKHSA